MAAGNSGDSPRAARDRRWFRRGLVGLVVALTAACSATGPAPDNPAPVVGGVPLPRPDHVLVAVFENEDAADVLGSADAPYLTSLAASAATFTDAHGIAHPSQPNYLALFSGSTHGVTDDSCPQQLAGENLASQLMAAGLSFVGYSEGLPKPGFRGCRSGDYARKHNPWVDFPDLPASVNQPFSAMPADYGQLPTVSFVVPDLCHDMHDCGVSAGDAWARTNLAPYVAWAQDHNSLLVVTFDEDGGSGANHIATLVAGASVRPAESGQRIDHYSLLRTLEDMYGLTPLGHAAQAAPLTGVWHLP